MNSYDWNIHEKLKEAKRVHISLARRNGKTEYLMHLINDLIDSGYDVVIENPSSIENLRRLTFRYALFGDQDILTPERCERAERFLIDLKGE